MFLDFLYKFGYPVIAGLLGYVIASYKFKTEKWWEAKIAAYQGVIDALRASAEFNQDALIATNLTREGGGAISKTEAVAIGERFKPLSEEVSMGVRHINRVLMIGTLWLSDSAQNCIQRYADELPLLRNFKEDHMAFFHASILHDKKYLKEFSAIAKIDLGTEGWPERILRWVRSPWGYVKKSRR